MCQFLYKHARCCIRPSSLPSEHDYQGILKCSFPEAKALVIEDFITRSKLKTRLEVRCKQKAAKELDDDKSQGLSLEEVTANNVAEFGRSARGYVAYLLGATQKLSRFTSVIVKGFGSFDLEILLVALKY